MVCDLIANLWKAWRRNPAWLALTIMAVIFTVVANPSAKPPQVGVLRVEVATSNKYIEITPSINQEDAKKHFEGRLAYIQLKKDGPYSEDSSWETIKRIESFAFEPIRVDGVFVSGGKNTLRRVRIVFPTEE